MSIRIDHAQRMIKIFAENERGDTHLVCSFVRPVTVERVLDGPRHAGRFVSLFGLREWVRVGDGGAHKREEAWQTLHSLLATKAGVSVTCTTSYCGRVNNHYMHVWL